MKLGSDGLLRSYSGGDAFRMKEGVDLRRLVGRAMEREDTAPIVRQVAIDDSP